MHLMSKNNNFLPVGTFSPCWTPCSTPANAKRGCDVYSLFASAVNQLTSHAPAN